MVLKSEHQIVYDAVVGRSLISQSRRRRQLEEVLERRPTPLEEILQRPLTVEEQLLEQLHSETPLNVRNYFYHLYAQSIEKTGIDALTGLYNRVRFDEELRNAVARVDALHRGSTLRRGEKAPYDVSLLALDIDHFKHVNDTYGHHEGDVVLQRVASILQDENVIREQDIAARVGGEEFSIILPYTNMNMAEKIAERVRSNIEAGCSERYHHATVSIGVANYFEVCASLDELKRYADIALYNAKKKGRNRVSRYEKP